SLITVSCEAGVEAVMAKFVRMPVDLDEFQYDDHDVLCHCGVKASRRISHTAANPGRKFFGCRKYKSKADSGCGYFDWVDDKVAALNDKIALVNALNDRIDLLDVVRQLEHKVEELKSENQDLQSTLTQVMRNPSRNASTDECSSSNLGGEYNVQSEIEALKKRVASLENVIGRQ
ncbi:hypothetical protein LINPERPRIM_LOCUS15998, partial [Linum perenne]